MITKSNKFWVQIIMSNHANIIWTEILLTLIRNFAYKCMSSHLLQINHPYIFQVLFWVIHSEITLDLCDKQWKAECKHYFGGKKEKRFNQADDFTSLGGVFANFHDQGMNCSNVLSPTTLSIDIASEISFRSSSVSFTLKEPMLLSRFFIFVVPGDM